MNHFVPDRKLQLQAALVHEEIAAAWCAARGITLKVTNNGHHWQFIAKGKWRADWFPSSSKFTFDSNWKVTSSIRSWDQAAGVLDARHMEETASQEASADTECGSARAE